MKERLGLSQRAGGAGPRSLGLSPETPGALSILAAWAGDQEGEGFGFRAARGRRSAHLAEGVPLDPSGLRAALRAGCVSASGAPSDSDSDSESKPEARNSSTVNSARRLRVTTPKSRLPASQVCPSPGAPGTRRAPSHVSTRWEAEWDPTFPTHRLRLRAAAMTASLQRAPHFRPQNAVR